MKTFELIREVDETGISGTGKVAEGVELPNGMCVMWWLSDIHSVGTYRDIHDLTKIHGHSGKTKVRFPREQEGE